jgi:NAD(P)H-hydrate epimerase
MSQLHQRQADLHRYVVTANQMRDIEARVFAAGMPVAALMEKVAGRLTHRIQSLYPDDQTTRFGILVGPGHNGGDALVVARELFCQGYQVKLFQPDEKVKELTEAHRRYAASLGIPSAGRIEELSDCDVIIDGLFGFGLTRSLEGTIAHAIHQVNQWHQPVLSIDLPSGLHTDTGATLGTAIRATRSLCLGLWKLAFLQDQALEYIGAAELVDFDLPLADIKAILGESPAIQQITPELAIASLPLHRSPTTHKYKQGHLLLVCGSRQYAGAAILAGLAARASGVGMLSIAVPESLKPMLSAQIPDAVVVGCPETDAGAMAELPKDLDLDKYQAIACGPGLTQQAAGVVKQVLESDCPLILDADGLNILATLGVDAVLSQRTAATILTPHLGEFKRLFPTLADEIASRIALVRSAATQSRAIVLLKGARVAIANPHDAVWLNPNSTPALARGGSGDVLTGLMGGLLAQAVLTGMAIERVVQSATWWHSQAGLLAAQERTEMGVDATTLTQYLIPALRHYLA